MAESPVNNKKGSTLTAIAISVLIAQTIIICLAALLVVGGLICVILLTTAGDRTWHRYLLDASIEPATHIIQATLLAVASFGVLGLLGILGAPSLINYFLGIFAEVKASKRWLFAANFFGWFAALVVSSIFWLVPGGQLIAFPLVIATATLVTAAILHHHLHANKLPGNTRPELDDALKALAVNKQAPD